MQDTAAHLELFRETAKKYTPEEWAVILDLVPTATLGKVLTERATKSERIYKNMTKAWEDKDNE